MCWCTPESRTPFCGKPECRSPADQAAEVLAANPEPSSLDAWNQVADATAAPLDMAQMDALVQEYVDARAEYDAKKKESTEAHAKAEALKARVLAALKTSNKTKYHVAGLGTVYTVTKFQISMPKTIDGKRELFNYLREQGVALEFLTVHHGTLNGYFNAERERDPGFRLPGVSDPVAEMSVGFKKGK